MYVNQAQIHSKILAEWDFNLRPEMKIRKIVEI